MAIPGDEQPYLMRAFEVPDESGFGPAQVEVELHRGIWITGRVTDQVTGEPVPKVELFYLPFRSNEYALALPEFPPGNAGRSRRPSEVVTEQPPTAPIAWSVCLARRSSAFWTKWTPIASARVRATSAGRQMREAIF